MPFPEWIDLFFRRPTWVYAIGGDRETDPTTIAQVDRELVEVIGATLALDSMACRHSALHGLAHWQVDHPVRVAALVDDFLVQHPELDGNLRKYALAAREGDVQ